jgi:hypothetical protein
MLRGRGSLLKPLQEKEPSRLQPERQLVAVAAEGRKPPEEAKVVACLVAEALDQQVMLRTMGEHNEKLFPSS